MRRDLFWLLLLIVPAFYIKLDAQVFDYVVAKDGTGDFTTIQAAIDSCPKNVRKTIFVKNGTYEEKVLIGSNTTASTKLISLIGQDPNKVIITWNDYNGKTIVYDSKTVTSGTPQSATFTVNAPDFYAENLTIANSYTAAQAVALYNVSDRETFKNCRIIGYQDTHYLKKSRRTYFLDCYIEGGVDYICAGGTAIFDNCTLHSVKNGGCVSAPEDITATYTVGSKTYYYGFIFRNCTLTSDSTVQVYLGRPWAGTSSSIFFSCKMENVKSEGWSVWSSSSTNQLTAFFAENNSMDMDGDSLDVSQRVSWSYQLTSDEVKNYYTNDQIYSFVSATYDPFTLVEALDKPSGLVATSDSLTWDAVDGAIGYVIYKNDSDVIGYSSTNKFAYTTDLTNDSYSVQAVSSNGNLSEKSETAGAQTSGISNVTESNSAGIYLKNGVLYLPENKLIQIYSLNGDEVLTSSSGDRSINVQTFQKYMYVVKVTTASAVLATKMILP